MSLVVMSSSHDVKGPIDRVERYNGAEFDTSGAFHVRGPIHVYRPPPCTEPLHVRGPGALLCMEPLHVLSCTRPQYVRSTPMYGAPLCTPPSMYGAPLCTEPLYVRNPSMYGAPLCTEPLYVRNPSMYGAPLCTEPMSTDGRYGCLVRKRRSAVWTNRLALRSIHKSGVYPFSQN